MDPIATDVSAGRADSLESERVASLLNFSSAQRLPTIMQTEAAECGLACLAMIACYHGYKTDLASLRQRFPVSVKGMTLADMMEIAMSLGLSSRPLRLELQDLAQLQLPCVIHWDLDHFVVLKRIKRGRVVIHDPALGERTLPRAELDKRFTGIALELAPGPNFKRKAPPPPLSLRLLAGSVHGLWRSLAQVFAMAAVLEVIALLMPQFVELVVDQVIADSDHDLLIFLGLSFTLLLLAQTTITALRTWTVMWISNHFNLAWIGNVFQHLLRLPQDYFLKRHLGDVVSRFGAINTIQQTITTRFVEIILDGVMAVLTFCVLFLYSPSMSALTVGAVLMYGVLRLLYFQIYRNANLSQILSTAKQQGVLMESMRGVQTIRLHNNEPSRTGRFLNQSAEVLNTSIRVQRLSLIFESVNGLAVGGQRIAVLWLGAWLVMKREFTAGMLMAYIAYADQFTQRAMALADYWVQVRLLRLQGERLADIVLTAPEEHREGTYVGPEPAPSVRFSDVRFRYAGTDPWTLDGCSFDIHAGEFVAIVGPSGCGKSTLARVLLGLLDPESGSVQIGGMDLRKLGKRTAREMIASAMQDDTLFSGTIAENIAFFDPAAKAADVEQVARIADIHDEIVAMPMGYFSPIGDMGSSLSGGQRQRLLLARALYRKPRILLLDEATSQLDVERERAICTRLRAMNLTRIVIAHRPETINSADRVLELRAGAIRQRSG